MKKKKNILPGLSTLYGDVVAGASQSAAYQKVSKWVKGRKKNAEDLYPYKGKLYGASTTSAIDNANFRTQGELDKWVNWTVGTLNKPSRKKWFVKTTTPSGENIIRSPLANPATSAQQYGLMQAVASGTAKVKGISKKVAEKFIDETPAKDRSRFAKELKKNPGWFDEIDAEALSEEWHGRPVRETEEVEETETYSEELAELADLEELGVLAPDFSTFQIFFKKDRPKLCAGDRDNLEIVGGDQDLDGNTGGIEEIEKDLVPLGYCYQIVYETDKHHLEDSNGYPESYEHYFGEEFYKKEFDSVDSFSNSDDWFDALMEDGLVQDAVEMGYLPLLVYNKVDRKILIVGGKYSITELGIKD